MNKLAASILFGAGLLVSACTVHHYHHQAPGKGEKAHRCSHDGAKGHGAKGHHGMPEGHPPVDGHGKKGHHGMPEGHPPVGGHGMKGHHGMPEGHPPVHGHGMPKGHGMPEGHGMKGMPAGHGMKGMPEGHGGNLKNPMEEPGHAEMDHANLPPQVKAFHDSFASVWHEESDAVRSTAACAKFREWETLAKGVTQHKAQREQAVAYAAASKDLTAKVKAISASCRKKKESVQDELTAAHDALHAVLAALAK